MVFHLRRPEAAEIEAAITAASASGVGSPHLLSLATGPEGRNRPFAFVHDCLRSRIGEGSAAFTAARRAFAGWAEFDLGWVRVANPEASIAPGQIVVVEAKAFGLWSLNLSRIVETVDTATRFGFVYSTTARHVEEGEEIFLLELDPADGGVWYHLEAISRPRHPLSRLAYPFTRALQHRFARESHGRMRAAVQAEVGGPSL